MARKIKDENGRTYVEKKPFYKKWWFWLLALIVVGGAMTGGEENAAENSTETAASNTSGESENIAEESVAEEPQSNLLEQYQAIAVGDLFNGGAGGSTYEEVVSVFGEPNSTSETQLQGVTSKLASWSPEGGNLFSSLTATFSDGAAVSKSVSGLEVPDHEEVTLEQFNAIPTDGSYSYDTAVAELGAPDGLTETNIGGTVQVMASWSTNVKGDLGANFNITFEDGVATGKSHYSMQ